MMRRLGITTLLALALAGGSSTEAGAIAGGREATPGAWPWMVYLAVGTGPLSGCGGSMIAPRWVLTAAHCTFADEGANYPPGSLAAVVGRHDRNDYTAGQESRVLRIFVHPDYDSRTHSPDVALLELALPIDSPRIQVAHPAKGGSFDAGRVGTVLGWGNMGNNTGAKGLMQADVPVATAAECESFFAGKEGVLGMPAWDGSGTLCGGYAGSPASPCYGDSGGPWVVPTKYGHRQIGTISAGIDCRDYSTYGNLQASRVREFIAAHVPEALATR